MASAQLACTATCERRPASVAQGRGGSSLGLTFAGSRQCPSSHGRGVESVERRTAGLLGARFLTQVPRAWSGMGEAQRMRLDEIAWLG